MTKDTFTIIEGAGSSDAIKGRIMQIKAKLKIHHLSMIVKSFKNDLLNFLVVLLLSK